MTDDKPFTAASTARYDKMRHLPFVPAIRVRAGTDLIFVSGVLGTPDEIEAAASAPVADMTTQAERVFTRIAQVLAAAGGSLGDVVRITKYMTDLDRHDEVVAVMRRHFDGHLPTSTTIEVRRLVPVGYGLEVDVIAAVRPQD